MGIGIKNINVHKGYSYHKYLSNQISETLDLDIQLLDREFEQNSRHQQYNLKGFSTEQIEKSEFEFNEFSKINQEKINKDNLNRYTRVSGKLAETWGLTGPLDYKKVKTIVDLELGNDLRTKHYVNQKNKIVRAIIDPSTKLEIEVSLQDMKKGFVIDSDGEPINFKSTDVKTITSICRKSAIEVTYTLDPSFSYAYQLMNEEQKKKFEINFLDSIDKTRRKYIEPAMTDYKGNRGQTLAYTILHKDNRDGMPFFHGHDDISNLILLENGEIRAIEMDSIREKGFHQKVDSEFTANWIESFKKDFSDFPIEAYDKEKDIIKNDNQRIDTFRVAFNKDGLKAISKNHQSAQKITDFIGLELKEVSELHKNNLSEIKIKLDKNHISEAQFFKKVEKANQLHEIKLRHLNSKEHKSQVHQFIKTGKSSESLGDKEIRLSDKVSNMKLKLKSADDVGKSELKISNESILENLTQTSPFFTENELITECNKSFGLVGEERARQILASIIQKDDLVECGYAIFSTKQKKFTTKSLIELEMNNIALMKDQLSSSSKVALTTSYLQTRVTELEESIGYPLKAEQRDFVLSIFSDANATILIGAPGTGKTSGINVASIIAKEKGFKTIGLGPTNLVANALGETQIDHTSTIHKFNHDFQSGKLELDAKTIIFLDEASMVGVRQFSGLLNACKESGAKLICVGDPNQIAAVDVGSTLNEFMNNEVIAGKADYLLEINRQKNNQALSIAKTTALAEVYKDGDAVKLLKDSGSHIDSAIAQMDEANWLKNKFHTTKEKLQCLVNDYMDDNNSYQGKLILASENKTVDYINENIQKMRLEKKEISLDFLSNGKSNFHINDRVMMRETEKVKKKDSGKDKYSNGEFGTIKSIKDGKAFIEFDSGVKKEIIINEDTKISLSYATTIFKSQGMTLNNIYIAGEKSCINNQTMFNVAATRNRNKVFLYTTQSEFSDVVASYKRKDSKQMLSEIYKTYQKSEQIVQVSAMEARSEELKNELLNFTNVNLTPLKNTIPQIIISDTEKIEPISYEEQKSKYVIHNLAEIPKFVKSKLSALSKVPYKEIASKPIDDKYVLKAKNKAKKIGLHI